MKNLRLRKDRKYNTDGLQVYDVDSTDTWTYQHDEGRGVPRIFCIFQQMKVPFPQKSLAFKYCDVDIDVSINKLKNDSL